MGQSCPGRFALGFGGDLERDQQECLWRREPGYSLFAFFVIFVLAGKVSLGTELQRRGSLRTSVLPGVGGAAAWRGLVRQS